MNPGTSAAIGANFQGASSPSLGSSGGFGPLASSGAPPFGQGDPGNPFGPGASPGFGQQAGLPQPAFPPAAGQAPFSFGFGSPGSGTSGAAGLQAASPSVFSRLSPPQGPAPTSAFSPASAAASAAVAPSASPIFGGGFTAASFGSTSAHGARPGLPRQGAGQKSGFGFGLPPLQNAPAANESFPDGGQSGLTGAPAAIFGGFGLPSTMPMFASSPSKPQNGSAQSSPPSSIPKPAFGFGLQQSTPVTTALPAGEAQMGGTAIPPASGSFPLFGLTKAANTQGMFSFGQSGMSPGADVGQASANQQQAGSATFGSSVSGSDASPGALPFGSRSTGSHAVPQPGPTPIIGFSAPTLAGLGSGSSPSSTISAPTPPAGAFGSQGTNRSPFTSQGPANSGLNPFGFGAAGTSGPGPASSSTLGAGDAFGKRPNGEEQSHWGATPPATQPFPFGSLSSKMFASPDQAASTAAPASSSRINFGSRTAKNDARGPGLSHNGPPPSWDRLSSLPSSSAGQPSSAPALFGSTPFSFGGAPSKRDASGPSSPRAVPSLSSGGPPTVTTTEHHQAVPAAAPAINPFGFGMPQAKKGASSPGSSLTGGPSGSGGGSTPQSAGVVPPAQTVPATTRFNFGSPSANIATPNSSPIPTSGHANQQAANSQPTASAPSSSNPFGFGGSMGTPGLSGPSPPAAPTNNPFGFGMGQTHMAAPAGQATPAASPSFFSNPRPSSNGFNFGSAFGKQAAAAVGPGSAGPNASATADGAGGGTGHSQATAGNPFVSGGPAPLGGGPPGGMFGNPLATTAVGTTGQTQASASAAPSALGSQPQNLDDEDVWLEDEEEDDEEAFDEEVAKAAALAAQPGFSGGRPSSPEPVSRFPPCIASLRIGQHCSERLSLLQVSSRQGDS